MLERLGDGGMGEVFKAEVHESHRSLHSSACSPGPWATREGNARFMPQFLVPSVTGTPGLPWRRRSHRISGGMP
jgi:hypothetical protein